MTLDFDLLRVMALFGWLRVLIRGEFRGFHWVPIDVVLVLFAAWDTFAFTLLHGTSAAFVNRLGASFDAIGLYFLIRFLIRSWKDLDHVGKTILILSVPVATVFLIELSTGRNLFSVFGGVNPLTLAREGRLRCRGAFPHPIMAGCFWAGLLPLIAIHWWNPRAKRWAVAVGTACGLVVIVACASSTPVVAALFGVLAACMFPLRAHARQIRWGVVILLAGLHMVMKKPVWHLISRVDVVGGSTGWHRYHLIDETINHFGEWYLFGTSAQAMAGWGFGLHDVTNQYVKAAVSSGIVGLLLYLGVIALAFSGVGHLWRSSRGNRWRVAAAWGLGVGLSIHCVSFMAVSYFGQIKVAWYLQLAVIASLVASARTRPLPRNGPAEGLPRRPGPAEASPAILRDGQTK